MEEKEPKKIKKKEKVDMIEEVFKEIMSMTRFTSLNNNQMGQVISRLQRYAETFGTE